MDQNYATLATVMHNLKTNGFRSGAGECPICGNFLSGAYYRVNGRTACAVCAIQHCARETRKVVFVRRALLVFGAAMTCLALPFLGRQHPLQDSIGLCVLIVGARLAWQTGANRRLNLDGPFKAS
jgi:hypothetical protein